MHRPLRTLPDLVIAAYVLAVITIPTYKIFGKSFLLSEPPFSHLK